MQYFIIWMQVHLLNWFMAGYRAGYARAMQEAENVMKTAFEDMIHAVQSEVLASQESSTQS